MSVPSPRAARLAASHLRAVEPAAGDFAAPTPALVTRACEGDVGAWAHLYQLCYPAVFRQLRYYTGDTGVAEELAQEAFAQAMASRERFDPARSFQGWLHGVALNVVRKYWRRQRNTSAAHARLEAMGRSCPPAGVGPDDAHLQRERSRVLYAVLAELPERLREAFLVRELQGLPSEEAAALLGITTGNLHVRVCRARAQIHAELRRLGWLPGGEP
ncbi:sigma-70 family RNA polymerase sigma factor [Nannocystis sp. ILAH1]|uniref:RNA polymerase sigma factor n=1 Tax=Nannocystis sp. ILAH1 TaxID=2996789 RepID=UPI00226ED6AE|nr:sigma-70 family RNA polymerase sigma factor [Nannocystis sp. ILAH1]MCY0987884.1 sigma-70 family RNA polymerase sigma factor [Nannocystis sp. ILAH1]